MGLSLVASSRSENQISAAETKKEVGKNELQTLVHRLKSAPIPVILVRLCPFAPVQKLTKTSRVFKEFEQNGSITHTNAYGTITTDRPLYFKHYKVFLDLLTHGKIFIDKHNRIAISFTIYDIAKKSLTFKDYKNKGGTEYNYIENIIDELYRTSIVIVENSKKRRKFHIIESDIEEDDKYRTIYLSNEFTDMLKEQILYNPTLFLQDMYIAYITLFLLTHSQPYSIKIKNLIKILGFSQTKDTEKGIRKALREYQDFLKNLGIDFTKDSIKYIPNSEIDVKFNYPPKLN